MGCMQTLVCDASVAEAAYVATVDLAFYLYLIIIIIKRQFIRNSYMARVTTRAP